MNIPRGKCHFCGKEVTSIETAARHASGWYVERGKGLHALVDRRDTPDMIAHAVCLRHPPGQESFAA